MEVGKILVVGYASEDRSHAKNLQNLGYGSLFFLRIGRPDVIDLVQLREQ